VQLLTPGNILRRVNTREKISKDEIGEIRALFVDAKTSARVLQEHSDKFLS
jgi:RuvB-like protein 1 (pontin 52)